MIAAELFFGFMLLLGWKPKFTVAVIWALTIFFTFLTGYTYLSGYSLTNAFMLMSAAVMVIFVALGVQRTDARQKANGLCYRLLMLVMLLIFFQYACFHPSFR
jgi:hypothetical protein